MSDLVGNPEDRFSRVAAHLLSRYLNSLDTWIMNHLDKLLSGVFYLDFLTGLSCQATSNTEVEKCQTHFL